MIKKFSADGLVAFLGSSFTKGIGKVFAKRIVDRFGFEITDPSFDFSTRLQEIPGLGEQKIREFVIGLENLKVPLPTLATLFSAGLSEADIEKIVAHYGKRLEKVLETDPYDMVENVWKLSYFTADKLGKFLDFQFDDERRIRGALLTAVKIYAEEGSLFASEEEALNLASKISGVSVDKIKPQIDVLVGKGRLVRSLDGIYLPPYFKAEKEAVEKLRAIIEKKNENLQKLIIPEKDLEGHTLSDNQRKAIKTVLNNKVTVITGGPGTGKTTTLNGIISLLLNSDKKVTLVAPTGRAAKRMTELTGHEASTIHRLLGYSMGRGYKNKRFETDLLVVDEASMLEQVLFNHLLQAVDRDTRILLVGDINQLPPIGAGNVLPDLIDSGLVPVIKLEENFRQRDGSRIAGNAEAIKQGELPSEEPSEDYIFVEEKNSDSIKERIFSLILKEIPSYTGIHPQDILLVTPQQEGPLGAKQLNKELQEKINPGVLELKRGLKLFKIGDKVMQTVNSSERGIYNGETGIVSNIDPEKGWLEVRFKDGKVSQYDAKELKELSLAYATTVHKLQGTETDYMVMIVSTAHRPMLYRNLLYTGISRAKKLCVIIGEEKALKMAVETTDKNRRNSNFKNRLQSKI